MRAFPAAAVILSLALSGFSPAFGAQYSLPLTADSWINGNQPSLNFGTTTALPVHNYGPKFALVRFDAATIAGKTVTQATLRVYLRSIKTSGQMSIYPIVSSWSENTVTWALQPPTESAATANVALTTAMAGTVISINVTSVAQRWANGSLPAAGFMLSTLAGINATFDSKELSGGTAAQLIVVAEDSAPVAVGSPARLLDLANAPIVIDTPGHYYLDRNWTINGQMPAGKVVLVTSSSVVIDLRGFEINADVAGPISITGDDVTLRNGGLYCCSHDYGPSVMISGHRATIENVRIGGGYDLALHLTGNWARIVNSSLGGRSGGARVYGTDASIEASSFSGLTQPGLILEGDRFRITNSALGGDSGGAEIAGNDGQIIRNNFDCWGASGISVAGSNVLIDNNAFKTCAAYAIDLASGTSNVVRGNISTGPWPYGDPASGIIFRQSGNFYGNNQMDAAVPFNLNGTTQTNWGGNVGF